MAKTSTTRLSPDIGAEIEQIISKTGLPEAYVLRGLIRLGLDYWRQESDVAVLVRAGSYKDPSDEAGSKTKVKDSRRVTSKQE